MNSQSQKWLRNKPSVRTSIFFACFGIIVIAIIVFPPKIKSYQAEQYLQKGISCFTSRDYNGALENFNKVLKLIPQSAEINYKLGKTFLMMEDFDKSEEYCRKALSLNPDIYTKAGAYSRLSTIYFIRGNYNKAIEYGNEAIGQIITDPVEKTNIECLIYPIMGSANFYLGNKNEAKEFLNKSLEIIESAKIDVPSDTKVNTYNILGFYYYFFEGDYNEAIRYFNKILEMDDPSSSPFAYYGLGKIYFNSEEYKQAIQYLSAALETTPLSTEDSFIMIEIYDELAKSYLQLGDCEKAIKYFNKVLKEKENINAEYISIFETASAYLGLGECALNIKNNAKALEYFNKGLDSFSGLKPNFFFKKLLFDFFSTTLNYKIADIYYKKGDISKAKTAIDKALTITQSISPDIYSIIERTQWPKNKISIFRKIQLLKENIDIDTAAL